MEKERKILTINEFHDIGNLPPREGLVILPISISRIQHAQSGKKCLKFVNQIGKKITRGLAGVNFIYTDNLYEKYNPSKENKKNKHT